MPIEPIQLDLANQILALLILGTIYCFGVFASNWISTPPSLVYPNLATPKSGCIDLERYVERMPDMKTFLPNILSRSNIQAKPIITKRSEWNIPSLNPDSHGRSSVLKIYHDRDDQGCPCHIFRLRNLEDFQDCRRDIG
jgi:hypothetical protein